MPQRVYNFNPGPATLPLEVLEEAQKNCWIMQEPECQ